MDIVANTAEESMNLAVREIKDLPGYSDNGEVCTHVTVAMVYRMCCLVYSG